MNGVPKIEDGQVKTHRSMTEEALLIQMIFTSQVEMEFIVMDVFCVF